MNNCKNCGCYFDELPKPEVEKALCHTCDLAALRAENERLHEQVSADTLGMQTSLSQMLYWATCYSLDCKHSKFMSTHRKTLMEREIAEAEALLKETPNDKG